MKLLNWLCLTGDEENDVSFYNLDQILMVTEVRQGPFPSSQRVVS
jgi:hypothetical protein